MIEFNFAEDAIEGRISAIGPHNVEISFNIIILSTFSAIFNFGNFYTKLLKLSKVPKIYLYILAYIIAYITVVSFIPYI